MHTQSVSTNAIILNLNKNILFVRRSMTDDYLPGKWELPGGGLDYGEEPERGLQREIKEECGISVSIEKPVAVSSYFIKDNQRIEITYLCRVSDGTSPVVLSHEHDLCRWNSLEEAHLLDIDEYIKTILQKARSELVKQFITHTS